MKNFILTSMLLFIILWAKDGNHSDPFESDWRPVDTFHTLLECKVEKQEIEKKDHRNKYICLP